MTWRLAILFAALALAAHPQAKDESRKNLSHDARADFLRAAQVWMPTDVSAKDLRAGPAIKGAFAPDEMVECTYQERKPEGNSKKFYCTLADGETVKVRYGKDNGEVEGSVLSSRLLWALGFGADADYPVHVFCRGCSADPFVNQKKSTGDHMFDIATIERKAPGKEVHAKPEGWSWPELTMVEPSHGGAPRNQIDALKLLAVLIQHTDNKSEQQRLHCLPGGMSEDGKCGKPFLIVHDVGLTFGHANIMNRDVTGSVSFELWKDTPIWRDKAMCIGHLGKSNTGTLEDPKISEGGRAFLSGLLDQLSDQQLHDLFEIGHVERRSRRPGTSEPPASVDEWVQAFRQKRAEINATHCPA
jgi:hypothetical protein